MRVIIDGCDGVGKTSVCEKLANKFACNIIRLTHDGDRSIYAYLDLMTCNNVVHDRSFLSEIIYPRHFERESRIKKEDINTLYRILRFHDLKMFILTASPETIESRVSKRGDEYITDLSKLKDINDDYLRVAKRHGFTVIDTTNKSIDEIVEEIGGYLI